MTGDSDWTTDGDTPLELLTLPASTLNRVSRPAVRDAIQYFTPGLITVPGARTPTADATARDAAPDIPVLHPQLGRGGNRVHHYRCSTDAGVHEAPDAAPPPETIDILAVQNGDVLPRFRTN